MTDKEFDIKIRSLMENAAEEVPGGVWESVSGVLDKAEGRKRRVFPVLWWSSLGIAAAAAAVVLGVFLWPEKKGSFSVVEESENALAAVVDPVVSQEAPAADPARTPITPARTPITPARPSVTPDMARRAPDTADRASDAADRAPGTAGKAPGMEGAAVQNPPDCTLTPSPEGVSGVNSVESHTDLQPEAAEPEPGPTARYPEWTETPSKSRSRGRLAMAVGGSALVTGRPSVLQGGPVRRTTVPLRAPKETGISSAGRQSTYGMPFTVGLGIRYEFVKRFSIGTGVEYSMLTRNFVGTYNEVSTTMVGGREQSAVVGSITTDMSNDQHYIGIPLDFSFDYVQTKRVRAYVRAGGTVEKNVSNHYSFTSGSEKYSYREKVKGVQWSVGAGLGVEVRLSSHVGIYVDPGVRYYFKSDQPQSLRTAQPLMVDLNAGFRFSIN